MTAGSSPEASARSRPTGGWQPLAALLLVQLFFGSFPAFGKIAMREVSPLVLAAFRAIFGAALLSLAARALAPGDPPLRGAERRRVAGLAFLGVVANQLLFISGLARTTATNATLLVATVPIFTLSIAILLGRERATFRRVVGIPIALLGVLVVLDPVNLDLRSGLLLGNLLVMANSLSYSFFLVFAMDVLRERSSIGFIASCFRFGALPILLVAAPDLLSFRPAALSGAAWGSIAAVVAFATVAAYALNAWALARTSASTAAIFIYVQPLIAGVLARVFLGERPGAHVFAAAALIFLGVGLTSWPPRRGEPEAAPAATPAS